MKKECRDAQLSAFTCRSHSIVIPDVLLPFLNLKDILH